MSDYGVKVPSLSELATHRSEKWRAFPPDVIPMPVAEMDFPIAPPIKELLHSMVEQSDLGYLGAIPELGEAFSSFAAKRWNWAVDPSMVRVATDVGVGVVEILRVFTAPGDGVLISSPVYQNFYTWMNETRVKCIDVPFIHQEDPDISTQWQIDWQGIEEAYKSGIKIHLLCSPHNPIGRVYSKNELQKFVALAVKYNETKLNSSAKLSIETGDRCLVGGSPELALRWYANAMAYTIGVFHVDYQRAISTPGATFTV